METELQRRFKTSGIKRLIGRYIMGEFAAEGLDTRRTKRLFNGIATDLVTGMSEPQIKLILFDMLQCDDMEPADRAEAIKLLQMSETALTAKQRKQIDVLLME